MLNLLDFPKSWGPVVEIDGAASTYTKTGPNILSMTTKAHLAILLLTAQPNRILAVNSDARTRFYAGMGTLELIPFGSELYLQWSVRTRNMVFALSDSKMRKLAALEFEKDDVDLCFVSGAHADNEFMMIANLIRRELSSAELLNELLVDSLHTTFWVYMLRRYAKHKGMQSKIPKGGLAPFIAKRVNEYIRTHLGNKITIEELAQVAQLSPSHFMRAFRETWGKTAAQYLIDLRLTVAADTIKRTDLRLSEIAQRCGFGSNSYMTSVMRQHWLVTPSELRKASEEPSRTETDTF